jgi:hypothetical protein
VGVTVTNVREMRVRVGNRRVLMRMRVRLVTVPLKVVCVLMVLVVPVVMVQNFVGVRMFMPLTDMQPDSKSHERNRNPERQRRDLGPEEKR